MVTSLSFMIELRYPHRMPQDGYQRLRSALTTTTHPAVGCNLHAFQPDRVWDGCRDRRDSRLHARRSSAFWMRTIS